MIFTLERVTDPVAEPVTLAEQKRHMRVATSVTEDDDDIIGLISAGREFVEDFTGRALIDQEWRLTIDGLNRWSGDTVSGFRRLNYGHYVGTWSYGPCGEIFLRRSPIISVTSFVTVDNNGVETPVEDLGSPTLSSYELREAKSKWPRLVPLSGVVQVLSGFLKIQFRAGFASGLGSPSTEPNPADVPVVFKQAIKLWAEAMYDRDEKMMIILLDTAKRILESQCTSIKLA